MKRRFLLATATVLILVCMLIAASCTRKALQSESDVTGPLEVSEVSVEKVANNGPPAEMPQETVQAESVRSEPGPIEPIAAAVPIEPAEPAEPTVALESIHFSFDSAELSEHARRILTNQADYLRTHPAVTILVEGHCDERGTDAYNLSLGQRRAETVKNYLVKLGISADRMNTVSFGERRPLSSGKDKAAWAKNRRAQFVINDDGRT